MKVWICFIIFSLAFAELMQCINDFTQIVNKRISPVAYDTYSTMALYSGFKRNDLGDYANCAKLDYAEYLIIEASSVPPIVFSLCGSKNCTEDDYRIIFNSTFKSAVLDSNLIYMPEEHISQYISTISRFQAELKEFIHYSSAEKFQHLIRPILQRSYIETFTINDQDSYPSFTTPIYFPQDYIQEHFDSLSPGAIVMLTFCSVLIAITVAGTIFDLIRRWKVTQKNKRERELMNDSVISIDSKLKNEDSVVDETPIVIKMLMCFSVYTNLQKLFLSRSSEKTGAKETLDIFNGVRVMSMGWVILGHVFTLRVYFAPSVNLESLADWYKNPKGAMIYGAEYAVDVFFWLSGFLVAYFFIMEYNAKKRMNWIYVYIHRFYRILPAYMFCLFLTWAFLKYIGNGPMWYRGDFLNNECKNYWWTNMLFLNNFIPDGDGNGCMTWCWYMANDMQFFIITPIILHFYHEIHRLIGWSFLVGLVFTHMLSSALIASHYNYSVAPDLTFQKIYNKPYCRIGPYAIGIMFGLIYYTYKHHQKTGKVYDSLAFHLSILLKSRSFRYISYLLGLFLINYLIFIEIQVYHDYYESMENNSPDPSDYWSQDQRNTFYALSRPGFVTGLGLILLPILMGYNQVACAFLSHEVWTPLARLSYCGYLIHYGLIYAILVSRPTAGYLSNTELFYDFIKCLILTYLAALPISLVVESPLMGIEKLMKGSAKQDIEKELK